jgi:HD superfamily phosphohydrolases
LHDIGHGPFSHLFEPILLENFKLDHEHVGKEIIIRSEVADKLKDAGINPKEIGEIITGEAKSVKKYLGQIIKSGLDADKLDFIKRDNFHSGAGYGNIDIERLVTTMEIWNDELSVNMTALYTFEIFILSRIKSFEAIYFHKTLRAAQILLLKAIRFTLDEFGFLNKFNVDEYLNLDDFKLWHLISQSKQGSKYLSRIESRNLIKCALEVKIVGNIIQENLNKILNEIKEDISKRVGIDKENIEFDLSSLPSVPYHNAYTHDPYEIPVVKNDGDKRVYKLSEVSSWIRELKPVINIFRIYTEKEHRTKVAEVGKKILENYEIFEESIY